MTKKRLLIVFLVVLSLFCGVMTGCSMGTGTVSSDDESGIESVVESLESEWQTDEELSEITSLPEESESEIESESVSSEVLQVPTVELSVTSDNYSISFDLNENDPSNVGEVTAIELAKGKEKIVIDDMSTRTIGGLLSGEQYILSVTYTYNVGEGDVSKTLKKSKYTVGLVNPELELVFEGSTESSIDFDIVFDDPSNICQLTYIKLVNEKGEITLDDLTLRSFEDIEEGIYELVVGYKYNLNKGKDDVEEEVSLSVATVINPLNIPDFIVEVEEGRQPVILQISDTQIIDQAQSRPGDSQSSYYAIEKLEERLLGYLRDTINGVKPDLILITGDLVYGKFDDNGTSLLALIEAMESFGIPWAPVFGNHDNESKKGVDWQCQQLENAEHCLFKQRTLTGNGNYTVGISQGGKLTRIFFMMDSNACSEASEESKANGHTPPTTVGFADDQVEWFVGVGEILKQYSPNTKVSFAFHIQIYEFKNAYAKYGFTNQNTSNNPINIDKHPDKEDGDFGYIGKDLKGAWDQNGKIFAKMVEMGVDSIYIGHEHCNNASVVYNGVRFQFSQKISTYDRCNWLQDDGTIISAYPDPGGEPMMGGTVNILDEDGNIIDAYIYYASGDPNA